MQKQCIVVFFKFLFNEHHPIFFNFHLNFRILFFFWKLSWCAAPWTTCCSPKRAAQVCRETQAVMGMAPEEITKTAGTETLLSALGSARLNKAQIV